MTMYIKSFLNHFPASFFGLLLSIFIFGCQPESTVPEFDKEKAKIAIEAANQKMAAAYAIGDADAVAACYTKDAKFMEPNLKTQVGRAAILEGVKNSMAAGLSSVKLDIVDVWGTEDMIVEEGRYAVGNGQITFDQGKYIVLWMKEDGEWKLHRDIYNSDSRLASPEETE